MNPLLSSKDVARIFGISEESVRNLVKQGKLLPTRVAGRRLRFLTEEVERCAKALTGKPEKSIQKSPAKVAPRTPEAWEEIGSLAEKMKTWRP